jgi:hypothetical protein
MAFHIPFNQRAAARQPTQPIYIGFEVPQPPRPKFNWWGFNGMWMSVASLMTAGFLSPVPLLISLVGLRRPGKKMASVGTFVSLAGVALASTIVLGCIASNNFEEQVRNNARQQSAMRTSVKTTHSLLGLASKELIEFRDENYGELPSDIDANMLVIKHVDPWGESLRYDAEFDHGIVRSAGPDRTFDTKDDITTKVKGETERKPLLDIAD